MNENASPGTTPIVIGSLAVAAGLIGGAAVLVSMLVSAFGDVAFVEAAERSRVLSQGITDAVSYGVCFASSVGGTGAVLIGLGVRRRRAVPSVAS